MTIDLKDLLNSILQSLDRAEHIPADDIPNIDLYMDQVTTFMDKRLRNTSRNPGEDKILTKTMINNYAKNDLLPSPIKKKYSKDHIILLIFIYYFKGIISISDIQMLLGPLADRFYDVPKGKKKKRNLTQIYEEVFSLEAERIESLKKEIEHEYELSQELFSDVSSQDRDFLRLFAFVSMLSYDAYVKKLLVEKVIDGFAKQAAEKEAMAGNKTTKTDKSKTDKTKIEK